MSFFRGVVKGAAKSVDKNIQDQLKFLREETSNVAKIRANRAIREQDNYQDAFDENLAEVKDLSRKVGGTDQFQFLLDKYGVAEAKVMAQQLYDFSQKDPNFNIAEQLKIEKREGPSVTAIQLAEFMTPKAKVPPSGGYNIGTGMTRMLGIDADAKVIEQSDRLIKAAGIPTNETKYTNNVPTALAGRGVQSWRMLRSSDGRQDYNELRELATTKLNNGDKKEAEAIMAYAELRLQSSDTSLKTNTDFSDTQFARYLTTHANYLQQVVLGLDKSSPYRMSETGVSYIDGKTNQDHDKEIRRAIGELAYITTQAKKMGINNVTISNLTTEALNQNKKLVLVNGELVLGSENAPLYDENVFKVPNDNGGGNGGGNGGKVYNLWTTAL